MRLREHSNTHIRKRKRRIPTAARKKLRFPGKFVYAPPIFGDSQGPYGNHGFFPDEPLFSPFSL
jgi:hypothetical protein